MDIQIIIGDITKMEVDAIVNAANTSLLGGGGVDGAIHRAAGPKLLEECRRLGGCKTGQAKITKGCHLKAKYVIHTVGPVWEGGKRGEGKLLRSCYESSLRLAEAHHVQSVAFPSISTGAYRYPKPEAAEIALATVEEMAQELRSVKEVTFVCFSQEDYEIYRRLHENRLDLR